MDKFEKMEAICKYLLSTFKYLTNDGTNLLTLASIPNNPYFAANRLNSYISPSGLCWFALRIGGFDKVDNLYSNYYQYGFTWESGHYLCYCEADGRGEFYQACPLTPTGYVDVKLIDFTDDSHLYKLNGWDTADIIHQNLVIKGYEGSTAEEFARENGLTFEAIQFTTGDINGDRKINTADAVVVLRNTVGLIQLDDKQLKAGDTNCDGKVNTADAVLILKFAVGMIDRF